MALDFPTGPTTNQTVTLGGKTLKYDGVVWKKVKAGSSGVTVYANSSSIPAGSSGNVAFATNNRGLYIHNGSNWYYAAMSDDSPTWTGEPNAAYVLATDGTATTVTLGATDPEGMTLTYSHSATGLVNEATITQGTGADVNVFTITPSTNIAHGGEFSVTFTVTDSGSNTLNKTSTFSLTFLSIYWKNISLSTGTSSVSDNKTFVDRSSSPLTVTTAGDPIQGTFNPYGSVWSKYFDGSSYFTASTGHTFGTGDFSVELWYYPTGSTLGTSTQLVDFRSGGDSVVRGGFYLSATGKVGWWNHDSSNSSNFLSPNNTLSYNSWHHILAQRTSGNTAVFVNGTQVAGGSDSQNYQATTTTYIFQYHGGGNYEPEGYLSNFRIVAGSAPYTITSGSPNTISVPTEPLTNVTNTILLLNSNRFVDTSSSANTITVTGTPKIEKFSPFPGAEVTAVNTGYGAAFFDGSGDYLTFPHSTSVSSWYTTDFTIEAWVYYTSFSQSAAAHPNFLKHGTVNSSDDYWSFGAISNGTLKFYYWNGAAIETAVSTATLTLNTWHHIAMCHDDSDNEINLYLDGVNVKAHTISGTPQSASSSVMIVGEAQASYFTGYISDVKILNTEKYTSNFTPPTSPVGNTNANLYLPMDNYGIYDKSQHQNLELVGNTTTRSFPFDSANLLAFNGSSYLTLSGVSLAGDFEISFWAYPLVVNSLDEVVSQGQTLQIFIQSNSNWSVGLLASNSSFPSFGTAIANSWQHIVVAKYGTNITAFLNGVGTSVYTSHSTTVGDGSTLLNLGRWSASSYEYNGYISDFKVSTSLSYTDSSLANFTPPTSASTSDSNTELLINNGIADSSSNNHTITNNGVTSITQKFAGVNPIYSDGASDYIHPKTSSIKLGSSNFCIEGWVYLLTKTGNLSHSFVDFRPTSSNYGGNSADWSGTANYPLMNFASYSSGFTFKIYAMSSMTAGSTLVESTDRVQYDTWTHVAAVRDGNTLKLFINGTLQSSTATYTGAFRDSAYENRPRLLASGFHGAGDPGDSGNQYGLKGYVSDVQILIGTPKYTSSFTPHTASFGRSSQGSGTGYAT